MTESNDILISEEDEWRELEQRFEKEGLDYCALKTEEKLLHVWRWLVDSESNLRSLRKMIDKLREQQHEDLEEMECYVGHIKELAEKRADHLESETMCLRSRLESSQHQTATLTTLLERSGLEGIADASLGEQVAFLIADRAKLMEEISILNKLSGMNGAGKEADLIAEIIKVSSEKEVLRHEAAEQKERVFQLEKSEKQLELDNERLAFKLSEALAELEERESQLKQIVIEESRTNGGLKTSWSVVWPRSESPSPPPGRRRQSVGDTLDATGRSSPDRLPTPARASGLKASESAVWPRSESPSPSPPGRRRSAEGILDAARSSAAKLPTDGVETSGQSGVWPRSESPSPPPERRRQSAGDTLNGPRKSSPVRLSTSRKKGSEPLKAFPQGSWNVDSPPEIRIPNVENVEEFADNTGSLPRSVSGTDRDLLRSQSYGADSTPPSLMLSEAASERLQMKLDAQIQASQSELVRLEEIKRLQSDADALKSQLNEIIGKYNGLVVRHIQHKARRKSQISDLKARWDLEVGALQLQIQSLQAQLTNQKLILRGEEGLRKRIESDYRKTLDEKRSLMVSLMSVENSIREKDRELCVLQKKMSVIENANSDLRVRFLQLKYAHPSRSRSLTRVEGLLANLGAV